MISWFRRLWRWIWSISTPAETHEQPPLEDRPIWRVVTTDDIPDDLQSATLYLLGEPGHLWCATLRCPCSCNAVIQLNLLPQVRPRWTVQIGNDGTASISPSVNRSQGCRSHFFFRRSHIIWAGQLATDSPLEG